MSYLHEFSTRHTPQSQPIPGTDQVANSAGGYSWELDSFGRMQRFLVLGNEGGSYYANQKDMTLQNASSIMESLDADPARAIEIIVTMSDEGRIPKNDTAIFALAIAASHSNESVRRLALNALSEVCRTGTHLFTFVKMVEQHRGWGRSLRRAVAGWYLHREPEKLAYQLTKYQQRDGVSHRDLLRLAHPGSVSSGTDNIDKDPTYAAMFDWVTHRLKDGYVWPENVEQPPAIRAYNLEQKAESPAATAALVQRFGGALPREAIQSDHLKDPAVWDALLKAGMPLTAMIRNLATMTRIGTLKPMSLNTALVAASLRDQEVIQKARVHPIDVLKAMRTYEQGHGVRGDHHWDPIAQIVDALDDAFYLAFKNVKPTGKRHMLCLDISGSMGWGEVAGVPGFTPRDASAALSLVTANTEPNHMILGFSHNLVPLSISPRQRLTDAIGAISNLPFGGTDCSLPMIHAMRNNLEVDVFVVYTDNETWAGITHPAQALRQYRALSGIDAKLIVNGMVANGFTIADPKDPGMLDVVGFDSGAVQVMAEFVR